MKRLMTTLVMAILVLLAAAPAADAAPVSGKDAYAVFGLDDLDMAGWIAVVQAERLCLKDGYVHPNNYPRSTVSAYTLNRLLKEHRWRDFAVRWWGPDYPARLVNSLPVVHDLVVQYARAYGLGGLL